MAIGRRAFIKGLGGALVALPALEFLGAGARAGGMAIPKRFLLCFGGMSVGRDGEHMLVPSQTGSGYTPTTALQPLADEGVQNLVSVLSGLVVPAVAIDQSPTQPGERHNPFHGWCFVPTLSGMRTDLSAVYKFTHQTADQIVADVLGSDTPVRHMAMRVQASMYGSTKQFEGRMSYRMVNGSIVPIEPTIDPTSIYEQLFGVTASSLSEFDRDRRVSVLDLIQDKASALSQQLGRTDRLRLEQHFDHIRDIETRLAELNFDMPVNEPLCASSPSLGQSIAVDEAGQYSNEELRAEVITEMIALAFSCDLVRAGSLMYSNAACAMKASGLIAGGPDMSLHECAHGSNTGGSLSAAMRASLGWHVKHFGRLVKRLGEIPEIDGSQLLDHCALSLVFEGGHGNDYTQSANVRANAVHSTENMVALLAGHAGGMHHGQHLPQSGRHSAAVLSSAMRAVGVLGGLGEISDYISEVF